MSLTAGTRFGPYEIVAPLGEGGMGEVYKAVDTRLDRTVALKVLPKHLSEDAETRRRFEREARAISSLTHPNICTLYDIGNDDGREFLVMEYLEGETLADRLIHGPLALDDVLRYGIDIADALEKAHRMGIIHRDLKPGNIVLTRTGAKLLDFGLAKWLPNVNSLFDGVGDATTQRQPLTSAGMIIGTIPYMAPEQLEGREIDARTDIFALGAILYEMTTGQRAFSASSNASLIAAILKDEPKPISRVRPVMPRALDQLIRTCLSKDPGERYQSAHDVRLALQMLPSSPDEAEMPVKPHPRRSWLIPAIAGALILGALAGVIAASRLHPREPARTLRFTINPPEGAAFPSLGEGCAFALSPDARWLVFTATTREGRTFLWLRGMDSDNAEILASTDGAEYPFWSPDSKSIGFFADGKLKRMAIPSGPPQTVCDAPQGRGGTWSSDGTILFAPSSKSGIHRVPAAGGQPVPVTSIAPGTYSHRWPLLLPDGEHFLYVVQSQKRELAGVYAASLTKPGEPRRITGDALSVAYAPPQQLFYVRDHVLVRQQLEPKTMEVYGDPQILADNITYFVDRAYAPLSAAADGTIAFRRNGMVNMRIAWYARNGTRLSSVTDLGEYEGLSLSPDGTKLAFGHFDPNEGLNHISISSASEGVPRRFSFHHGNQYSPIWSPDGARIAFSDDYAGVDTLSAKPSTGAGEERALTPPPSTSEYALSWSPDGKSILFRHDDPRNGINVMVLSVGAAALGRPASNDDGRPGAAAPTPYLVGMGDESQAQFSPDGRWVAYTSTESGRPEVYVQPFPATGAKWQVSTTGGDMPRWRRDGKEMFYHAPDRKLMAVPIRVPGAFDADPPVPLFDTSIPFGNLSISQAYDVTPDGQRFVIASVDPFTQPAGITVITTR